MKKRLQIKIEWIIDFEGEGGEIDAVIDMYCDDILSHCDDPYVLENSFISTNEMVVPENIKFPDNP